MNMMFKRLGLVVGGCLVAAAVGQTTPRLTAGQPDRNKLAQQLVNECARIVQGDKVLISGGVRDLDLLENIAVEVRKLGAHPLVTLESERLVRRMYTDVPKKFDTLPPEFAMRMAETIDAHLSIEFLEHPDLLSDIPANRLAARAKTIKSVYEKMMERGVRRVHLGNGLYPTEALATQFGVSTSDLSRIFWRGVNVDYAKLQNAGETLRKELTAGNRLTITAPNGTDLTVKITRRPVFVSDGVISSKDHAAKSAATQVWLPAGEVYLTPVPDTAEGVFVADTFFYEGKLIEGLKLEFEDGKLTKMTAKRGDLTPLRKRYDAAPAGRDALAFVDIGFNPNVKIPDNSRMVTWMAAGTISVGVGGNTWAGGENDVPFMMAAHLDNGTLLVDRRSIVRNGELLVGKMREEE